MLDSVALPLYVIMESMILSKPPKILAKINEFFKKIRRYLFTAPLHLRRINPIVCGGYSNTETDNLQSDD